VNETANTKLIETIFEAFGAGDIPFILEQLADDARFTAHLDPAVPWAGEYDGKPKIVEYFQSLGGSVEVLEHPVAELVAQRDTVVASGDVTFRARSTGTEATSAWIYVWKVRDGKVASFDQFNDANLAGAFAG
jgi:ketosteroid isomerase-like protein